MEFSAYWRKLTLHQPQLGNDENKITLTIGQLKKQMAKAFVEGYDERMRLEKELKPKNPFDKLFGWMP